MSKRTIFQFGRLQNLIEGDLPAGEETIADPKVTWIGPKFPYLLWRQLMSFFVAHKMHEVCAYMLLSDGDDRKWVIYVPEQSVGGASVNIDHTKDGALNQLLTTHTLVGNVHTHPDFGAFMSPTDQKHERTTCGVYITVGKVDCVLAEIDIRTFVNGHCYKDMPDLYAFFDNPLHGTTGADLLDVALLHTKTIPEYPVDWDARIKQVPYSYFGDDDYPGATNSRATSKVNDVSSITELFAGTPAEDYYGEKREPYDPYYYTDEDGKWRSRPRKKKHKRAKQMVLFNKQTEPTFMASMAQ